MKKLKDLIIKYKEIILYLIFGFLTTVVSLAVYYLLTFTILNPNNAILLQIANIISWILGVAFAYVTNRKYVFESKNKNKIKEITSFVGARVITLILDMLIMGIGVSVIHFDNRIVKIISQIVVIVLNYVFSKLIVFKKGDIKSEKNFLKMFSNKKKVCIVFCVFFLLLLLQIHFVWLYYDDYGYASLSYLSKYDGNMGMNTSLTDVISFLVFHYNNWGGRVLWFFLEIFLLRINISAYRIVESIVVVFIFYFIYKLISKIKNVDKWQIALTTVVCFGLIEIMVLREGFYWFTASVLYLFPILPIIIYIYLTFKDEKRSILKNILCGFLLFISAWSQEQVSIFITCYVLLQFAYKLFIKKNIKKVDIIFLIITLIGFGILMLSPGSRIRIDGDSDFYSLNIIQKFVTNIPLILSAIFGEYTKMFTVVFLASAIILLYRNRNIFKYKIIVDVTVISTIIILLISIFTDTGYVAFLKSMGRFQTFFMILYCLQFILLFAMLTLCYFKNKHYALSFITIASVVSQLAMIMAPYIPNRSITIFVIMSFITIIYVCADLININKFKYSYILIPLFTIAIINYCNITHGYYLNNVAKSNNDKLLREASEKIKQGEVIDKIEIAPTRVLYGIYERKSVYGLMHWYYDIPENVEIEYVEEQD